MSERVAWIIGSRGFVGRNMSGYLARRGFRVLGAGPGGWTTEAAAEWGVSYWIDGDITVPALSALLGAGGSPHAVFHFAGTGSSPDRTPLGDLQLALDPASRLLEFLRKESPESPVVIVSNAAVYGCGHLAPIPETAAIDPCSAYGTNKAVVELVARSYARDFGLRVRVARLFSVYGPGLERQLLWDLCRKLAAKVNPIVMPGTGREARDWIHVTDVLRALETLISPELPLDHVVNVGTGWGMTVREIADLVRSSWGEVKTKIDFDGKERPGDPNALVADVSRLHALGVIPETPVERGVAEAVAWYRDRLKSGVKSRITGVDGNA